MDYSKWDEMARQESENEKLEKERERAKNRENYYKEQEEKKQKWEQLQKEKNLHGHGHGHGHSDGHGHGHGHGHGTSEDSSSSSSSSSSSPSVDNQQQQIRRPTCGCGYADPEQIKQWQEAAKAPPPSAISESEKLAKKIKAIDAAREHGKQLFGEGSYEQAFAVFERGVLIINGIVGLPDDQMDALQKIECILDVNMAACKLKLLDYLGCIDQCRMALNIDRRCVKAYFRLAQAQQGMGNYDDALSHLEDARKIAKKDGDAKGEAEIEKMIDKVKLAKREQEEKAKREMRAMQERMKKALTMEKNATSKSESVSDKQAQEQKEA